MTTILKSGGLQHAYSLGNIDTTSKHSHFSSRSYDSEDENVGRRRNPSTPYPKPSIYSKADIQEQYCLSERQLNTIEQPRRDGFFGCWSNRGNQQSFLSVCVGRRHPSDENLADYAPFHKYPKYTRTNRNIIQSEDEIENFHFRRRPTSFLCSNDPKRFTWMAAEQDAANADGSRAYRCPSHVGVASSTATATATATPSNLLSTDNVANAPPRTKHVSFARSHTLTSFEDLSVDRSVSRLSTTKSQERLIGGKKARSSTEHLHHHQMHHGHQYSHEKLRSQESTDSQVSIIPKPRSESELIEKLKRNVKKTQATQTDVFAGRRLSFMSNLSMSPRSRVCINGNVVGRKLTKSFSEAMTRKIQDEPMINMYPHYLNHDMLHRTQSEEPPRSPREIYEQQHSIFSQFDGPSQLSSHPSDLATSKSDIFMSEHMHAHSRNLSQASAMSDRSIDSHDIVALATNNNFIDSGLVNTNGCIDFMESATQLHYNSNSLPRRKCFYHANEYQTNSLPRRQPNQYDFDGNETSLEEDRIKANLAQFRAHGTFSLESNASSIQSVDVTKRRYSCAIPETMRHLNESDFDDLQSVVRRNSVNAFYNRAQSDDDDDDDDDDESETDEYCSTCDESEDDSKIEKEIFIDFKPSVSPIQSPYGRTRLQKTMSEGEIMFDKRREINHNDVQMLSTSEDELKVPDNDNERYSYSPFPIKDENICDKKHFLKLPKEESVNGKNRREAFRKRSISLEQSPPEDNVGADNKSDESKPSSPVEKYKNISTFPSSDSLANDLTRDHSDGNWNESQVTVLQIDPNDSSKNLLTPSEKRKNLILQHQQRSSMDTEAIEIEDHSYDQPHMQLRSASIPASMPASQSPRKSSDTLRKPSISTSVHMPSIAVTPSTTLEDENNEENVEIFQKPTIKVGPIRSDLRRKSADPIEPIYSNVTTELQRSAPIAKSLSDQQPFIHHSESRRATAADISEGSTNTEDYITCTDASKRGIVATSSTQMPVAAQGSQTLTQNGSSFESASSIYSLARVENICEDAPTTTVEDTLPLPPPPPVKPSPSHSISSSSSGSYFGKKPIKPTSPRSSVVIQQTITPAGLAAPSQPKSESISDDEKSEKRYSSSGYYESPHDDEPCRMRKQRDWTEDDRRRRKEKMRLDIEKENMKSLTSLTSPTNKPICFKRISPDDRTALHILDGTSSTKTKRIRPKTRRSPRARNPNEDPFTRKVKTPVAPGAERVVCDKPDCRNVPSKYAQSTLSPSHITSPKKPSPEKRLKAISTESLRSVSPGSDSVFYSEVDVHCHHCGKEVEIITALDDTEQDVLAQEDTANIVKPPADFADSPEGTRQPHQRMYKKLDRRLRSEERGERRHYRNRQDSARAKSEERGKDDASKEQSMRAAGSSPCVGADGSFNVRNNVADPEQGIYHGLYRLGMWICITDRDVWHRSDFSLNEDRAKEISDRRPSTESEKDFRKKYQAITHRLVHRKSCVEMYRRQSSNTFNTDKTIIVRRESGEFGFRIHGSKPVVVSAIEPETPAESSGLEIGDIVLSVNGVSVIDKSHSEVVKIAHAGSDILELEVARTFGVLSGEVAEVPNPFLYSGYLWRQGHDNQTGNKKWVRRWFALRPDHCLYYYKSEQESQPVGAILLTNHSVESCSADIGRPFSFRISLSEGTPLYLAADTEEAASRWIAVTSHASKQSDPWLEMSTRNLRLPPNNIPRPDCFGYLLKLGNRWRTWSKRYCVLKDACLYFYLDGSSKNALGMACLQGYRVQISNNAVGKKYAFEVSPPEPKLRHYCFSTDSDMDKKRWVAALEYSIDRWMKAS